MNLLIDQKCCCSAASLVEHLPGWSQARFRLLNKVPLKVLDQVERRKVSCVYFELDGGCCHGDGLSCCVGG